MQLYYFLYFGDYLYISYSISYFLLNTQFYPFFYIILGIKNYNHPAFMNGHTLGTPKILHVLIIPRTQMSSFIIIVVQNI